MNYSIKKMMMIAALSGVVFSTQAADMFGPLNALVPRISAPGKRTIAAFVAVAGAARVGYWLWQKVGVAQKTSGELDKPAENDVRPFIDPLAPYAAAAEPMAPVAAVGALDDGGDELPPLESASDDGREMTPLESDLDEEITLLKPDGFALRGYEQVQAFITGLYAYAESKGQAFTEGTFVIEDFDGVVFNWLRSIQNDNQRISTHFKEYRGMAQYGLDVSGLPDGKRTLLFGQFEHRANNKKYIFIKPESHGVDGLIDKILHTASLIKSKVNKFTAGADDVPTYRKEHIPHQVVGSFKAIIDFVDSGNRWLGVPMASNMASNVMALSRFFGYTPHRDKDVDIRN